MIVGFRPPARPEAVFVWQIGVSPAARGKGLGRQMLAWLMAHQQCPEATHLEATVSPDNEASQRMFRGFARAANAECIEQPLFRAEHFPETAGNHEDERLFRIGPVDSAAVRALAQQVTTDTTGGTG